MGEKFCRWDDKGTGINPFRPIRPQKRHLLLRGALGLCGLVLGIIRIPLIFAVLGLLFFSNACLSWVPLRFLRRPLTRATDILFARLALLLLGFLTLPTKYAHLRRLRLTAASKRLQNDVFFGWGVRRGDLLLCNFSSFVQILALAYWFSPTFTAVVPGKGTVVRISLASAFWRSFSPPSLTQTQQAVTLQTLVTSSSSDGPIVVFPEGGARTNGKGLLQFEAIFGEGNDSGSDSTSVKLLTSRIHLVAFTFPAQMRSPAQPMGHLLSELLRMGTNAQGMVKMETQSLSSEHIPGFRAPSTGAEKESKMDVAKDIMAKMMGVKTLELAVTDYLEFYKYYHAVRK